MDGFFTVDLVASAVRLSTPILLAAVASALCNRVGLLNLAVEGTMLTGCFAGLLVAATSGSGPVGVVAAALVGAVLGAALSALDRVGGDLVVFAIGFNLLALQATVFLTRAFLGDAGGWRPDVSPLPPVRIPVVADIPVLGGLLSGYNGLVYLSWAAVLGYAVLFRTRPGRHLLATGESPAAAAGAGIPVHRVQLVTLCVAGALCGIAGAFLSVGNLGLFTRNMTDGRGWIAVTAALLALNSARGLLPAAFLFGVADAVSVRLQTSTSVPPNLVQFLPHVAALVALVAVGLHAGRRDRIRALLQRSRNRAAPGPTTPTPTTTTGGRDAPHDTVSEP
ncbi:ABC transporter permease [Pseudonocardia sp. WMMC193]|uniref:ABC transporter permease n=1 Tax=Pseudonocardia sp. WMMC193 TaxID=2911965 RepID=UPI001F2C1F92|nr:ABC transporter permease [Pseudonocardia sp. WMMC193]MCF7548212.1 ABC transporter permease [Pseudonocardia sp. WMMC193]